MAKFDSDEILKDLKFMIQCLGSWPLDTISWRQSSILFLWMSLLTVVGLGAFIQALIDEDFNNIAFGMCCAATIINIIVKYAVLLSNKSNFSEIVETLKNPLIALHKDNLDVFLQKRVRLSKLVRNTYMCATAMSAISIIISPLAYLKSNSVVLSPFPLDMRKQSNSVYGLVWFFQGLASIFIGWTSNSFDTMVFTFMEIGVAQLEMLRKRIINIMDYQLHTPKRNPMQVKQSDTVTKNYLLRKCVIQHVIIDRYFNCLQEAFGLTFLSQLLTSVIIICLVGFNAILVPVTSLPFARCVSLFGAIIIQLSVYCLPANEIIDQSEQIGTGFYMSNWHNHGPLVRKSLLLIMQRSQRPFSLSAGKFVTLSHVTFLAMLRSSFSYFNVLWQLYSNSEDSK